MEISQAVNVKEAEVSHDFSGRRFYGPGVIAIYCILSLPVGLYLYGLNTTRRGSRITGRLLSGLAAFVFLCMIVAGSLGVRASGFGLWGILVGIALLNMEARPYRAALSRGGVKAKWWPPALWALGFALVMGIMMTIFKPEGAIK